MTIGNPIIGEAPIKSMLAGAVDIPFVVDLTTPSTPFVVNTPEGFSVAAVYDDDEEFLYWTVTIQNTFYAYLEVIPTIRIATAQAAACLGSVQITPPVSDPSTGITFNFFITGPSVTPTNFNGVSFLLRATNWSYST